MPKTIRCSSLYYIPASDTAPEVAYATQQGNLSTPTVSVQYRGSEIDENLSKGLAAALRKSHKVGQPEGSGRVRIPTAPFNVSIPDNFQSQTLTNSRMNNDGKMMEFTQVSWAKEFFNAQGGPTVGVLHEDGTVAAVDAEEAALLGAETASPGNSPSRGPGGPNTVNAKGGKAEKAAA